MTNKKKLLLTDDDETFCLVLEKALTKREYEVHVAYDVKQAQEHLKTIIPDAAVVDLNMPNTSGLNLIPELTKVNKDMQIVVLTGYASIATAVEAIKLGANNYLTKPSDADEIVKALSSNSSKNAIEIPDKPMNMNRIEWEHIQKVLMESDGNISEAARRLGMHRRTLQRKLQKRPSRLE